MRPDAVDVSSGVESAPGQEGRGQGARVRGRGEETRDDDPRRGRALRPLRRALRARDADGAAARAGGGLRRRAARSRLPRASSRRACATSSGRPTPLTRGATGSPSGSAAALWLKREDLCHTGAHKINNALGQAPAREAHGQDARGGGDGRGPARRGQPPPCARCSASSASSTWARRTWRARPRTCSACACWARRCAAVDSRRAHAQGRDQRGHARLGHERAHHALPAGLGAGRASVPDDGARLPGRDRRRGARADPGAVRARCPTCWWPASAAAPTRSASSTPSWTIPWRWSAWRRAAASSSPGDHAARFLGRRRGRRACCTARARTCCRTRRATCCPRTRCRPASTIPAIGPEHAWLRDEGRVRYDTATRRRGAGRVPPPGGARKGSSPRSSRRTRWPGWCAKRRRCAGKLVLVNLSGRGDKDLGDPRRAAAQLSRIARALRAAAARRSGKAFVAFVTAGDPSLDRTVEIALDLRRRPASTCSSWACPSPIRWPTAPSSSAPASARCARARRSRDVLEAVRAHPRDAASCPCCSSATSTRCCATGSTRLAARRARRRASDGVLVTDLPPGGGGRVDRASRAAAGLDTVFLAAPTSPDERLRAGGRRPRAASCTR